MTVVQQPRSGYQPATTPGERRADFDLLRRIAKLEAAVAVLTERTEYGAWDDNPLRLGTAYVWVDGTGDLRIKATAPASDTDGTVVGTQT